MTLPAPRQSRPVNGGEPHVRSGLWLAAGVVAAVALFVLGAQPVAVGLFHEPWDKLAHAAAFGAFFLVLDRALRWPRWLLAILTLLVSVGDEIHQAWLPGRHPGFDDWLAGAAGVAVVFVTLRCFGPRTAEAG